MQIIFQDPYEPESPDDGHAIVGEALKDSDSSPRRRIKDERIVTKVGLTPTTCAAIRTSSRAASASASASPGRWR